MEKRDSEIRQLIHPAYFNKSIIFPMTEERQLPARNLWKNAIVSSGSVQLFI
ncbi:hypothetical protein [Ignatzschineria sp. F8392]|uniref:hypothetical protein n=1 Tax=Ignatzschineria sp. F8392 TaxID=1980117 RepID=UPI0013033828|nr:hypothetical protein [Ignatzschineria sp. F8392]